MAAKRKIRLQTQTPEPAWELAAAPEWFQMPTAPGLDRTRQTSMFSGDSRCRVRTLIEIATGFGFALPPWQRPFVWTEDQQIRLLDSLMRGISIGTLTLWHAPLTFKEALPFPPQTSVGERARLILDGQQRITTLLKAAAGDLDHWRWNGEAWTQGQGFLTPSLAVRGPGAAAMGWYEWVQGMDKSLVRQCLNDIEAIASTDLTLTTLEGSSDEMIETYRRMATCGAQHTLEELALMEAWHDHHNTQG